MISVSSFSLGQPFSVIFRIPCRYISSKVSTYVSCRMYGSVSFPCWTLASAFLVCFQFLKYTTSGCFLYRWYESSPVGSFSRLHIRSSRLRVYILYELCIVNFAAYSLCALKMYVCWREPRLYNQLAFYFERVTSPKVWASDVTERGRAHSDGDRIQENSCTVHWAHVKEPQN